MSSAHTVVQCSGCGILSSLGEFPRSIIGEKCGRDLCNGVNEEISFEDRNQRKYFVDYNNRKLLEDLKKADDELKRATNNRNKIYAKCIKNKLI